MTRLLRRDEVQARIGVRRTTFFKMVAAGELPKPITVTGKLKAWPECEIEAWIADRITADRRPINAVGERSDLAPGA